MCCVERRRKEEGEKGKENRTERVKGKSEVQKKRRVTKR